jgi:catalase
MNLRLLTLLASAMAPAMAADAPSPAEQKPLSVALVEALNKVAGGPHQGFRANHAKGTMATGHFIPAKSAAAISKAPHFNAAAPIPITVRYSNDSGRIKFSDGSREARPYGMAIRFHLPDKSTTDIVTNTTKAFPVSTPEEFLALLNAAIASGPDAPKPTPIEQFIATHPTTKTYFTNLNPPAVSFGTLTYFGLNAFKFTNARGESRYMRYQIRPAAGEQYISEEEGAKAPPNYMMEEMPKRLAKGPVKYTLVAQLAQPGDNITDPAHAWPATNPVVELGTISVEKFLDDPEAARTLLFNPVLVPEGIQPSADPILALRFPAYAVSFQQRATAPASGAAAAPAAAKGPASSEVLAKSKNCLNCHAIGSKLVGPAYHDVAVKYAGQAEAEDKLVRKVLKGGSGVWGQIPMPPNTQVSEVEARTLVRWVLQQK